MKKSILLKTYLIENAKIYKNNNYEDIKTLKLNTNFNSKFKHYIQIYLLNLFELYEQEIIIKN